MGTFKKVLMLLHEIELEDSILDPISSFQIRIIKGLIKKDIHSLYKVRLNYTDISMQKNVEELIENLRACQEEEVAGIVLKSDNFSYWVYTTSDFTKVLGAFKPNANRKNNEDIDH